ncbi:MAG TPA: DUF742 domain-containing protein [Streptosporangiaceae bacterium]
MRSDGKWVDRDAGPVVRPYALTGGRTEPAGGDVLDLVALVVAVAGGEAGDPAGLTPEHRHLLRLSRSPVTVADLAATTTLPVGVVRVLLADLISQGLVTVAPNEAASEQHSTELLKEVLHGLRAL